MTVNSLEFFPYAQIAALDSAHGGRMVAKILRHKWYVATLRTVHRGWLAHKIIGLLEVNE